MMNADLRRRCEAIARLEQQRKELADEIKELKATAKSDGYDVPLITKTVSLMLKDADKQKKALDQHCLFDTYLAAVGLLPDDEPEDKELVREAAGIFADALVNMIPEIVPQAPETKPQPPVASGTVERSGGLDASPGAPAAPIQNTEPEGYSAGEGEPLTDETVDGVSGPVCDVIHTLKSADLAHSFEHQPSAPASQTADQAAGVPRITPAADLYTDADMDIPDFLRRPKRLEVA